MCCFSGKVQSVTDTNIFARSAANGLQFLVYQMKYESADDVAMILPIPTVKNPRENAVRFFSLEKFPQFFSELDKGFPRKRAWGAAGGGGGFGGGGFDGPPPLKVKDVGQFEASFVPTFRDFSRLDERFRLPDTVWTETVPRYKDYGFVVFQLKSGNHTVHPMAFSFPRRDEQKLFFPTMHIHDGEVHADAEFDHTFYCQFSWEDRRDGFDWRESDRPAGQFLRSKFAKPMVDTNSHVYTHRIEGEHKNQDILI